MYIGVDLGGTNIAVGLVDIEGNILEARAQLTTQKVKLFIQTISPGIMFPFGMKCRNTLIIFR